MNSDEIEKKLDVYDKAQKDAEDAIHPLSNEHLLKIAEASKKRFLENIEKNRHVPLANELEFKCICCGKKLEIDDTFENRTICEADKESFDYASCHIITPGYGSRYDMVEFLIGICDDCICKAVEDKRIPWKFNLLCWTQ